MSRNVWIYAGVLAALLLLAWLRWTGNLGSESAADEVTVFRATPGEIEKIAWHEEKQDVLLEVRRDDLGPFVMVSLEERRKQGPQPPMEEPAEAGDDVAYEDAVEAPGDGEDEPVEIFSSTFKGGEAADSLMESLAPLVAVRALDVATPEKLEELELTEPEATLEITRKGKVRRFEVGGEAYGTRDRYLRDAESGRVYLVKAETTRPLSFARTRLPDRRLTDLERRHMHRAEVQSPHGQVELLQQNREDPDKARWVSASAPDRKVSLYENWLDKVLRLKGLRSVETGEEPEGLEPAFTLTIHSGDGAHVIQVFEGIEGDDGPEWYARSNFSRQLLELHHLVAAEAAADAKDLVEARPEELEEEPYHEPGEAEEPGGEGEEAPAVLPVKAPGLTGAGAP